MTDRLELNWKLDGFVDEQRYYCSETAFTFANLPTPKAILANNVRSHVDTAITANKTYYIAVGAVKNSVEKLSAVVSRSTLSGDEHWNNVVFYCRFNDSAVDLSLKNNQPTLGSQVTYSATGAKFGKALYVVNNVNQMISYPASEMGFAGGEDFTIEGWVYCTLKPTDYYYSPFGTWTSNSGWCFFYTPTGIAFYFNNLSISKNLSYSANELHAICVTRENGVIRLFFNGVLVETLTNNATIAANSLKIGGNGVSSDRWRGYIDEVRITKGIARYVADYTPQDQEFYNSL